MLKKDITSYNLNVFDEIGNKWGIVTGGDKTTGFNCLTVSWGGFGVILSLLFVPFFNCFYNLLNSLLYPLLKLH